MASRNSTALLLALNLIFFSLSSAQTTTTCPIDALQFGACANVLGLLPINLGKVPTKPCCGLIGNLVALEVGACLCTALNLNVLNIVPLDLPMALSFVVDACNLNGAIPSGWNCP
ncbi:hypothetical protein LIER_34416 [Lithospermum erythrorhizon]|uniref:Hydrophobic seed protein domain-containing protein n=1 Tax=Lithospermum erythrorhizon TaxID=34254 RepID=A0AAV3RZL5_LITER